MKKRALSLISLILALIMLASCTPGVNGGTETSAESNETTASEEDVTTGENEDDITLEGEHGSLISNASSLANGVNAYFDSRKHQSFIFEILILNLPAVSATNNS